MSVGADIAISLEQRMAIQEFLALEAELLDDQRFEDWLALFCEDIEYVVPVTVTRKAPAAQVVEENLFFDEDLPSLTLRVKRLRTDVAWAEDPPSHTRRFVTNVRVRRTERDEEFSVRNSLMLFRSRGDLGAFDLIVGERTDILRVVAGELRIARRRVVLDQSSLSTKNLGVFL